jgi:hypothetical protein
MPGDPTPTRRTGRLLLRALVTGAVILVGVGIAVQGLAVGLAAVVPLVLASVLGQAERPEPGRRWHAGSRR